MVVLYNWKLLLFLAEIKELQTSSVKGKKTSSGKEKNYRFLQKIEEPRHFFSGSYCRVLGKGGNCKFLQKKKESADFFLQEIEATAEFFEGWGETVDFFTKYFIFHLIEMKVKPIKDKPDRWNVILFVRASKKLIFILFLMSFLQPRIV